MFIGGRWVQATEGGTLDARCPATGELIATLPSAGPADVDCAVQAASEAFTSTWRDTSPKERADVLFDLADRLARDSERLAMIDVVEGGSTLRRMRADVAAGVNLMRTYAGLIPTIGGRTIPLDSHSLNYTLREPWGVVGVIVPFNHPFMFAAQVVGSVLAAGNTLVYKPSEFTSLSALEVGKAAEGLLPPGVLNILTGDGARAGAPLVRHPKVDKVHFKGSVHTGRVVLASGAATVKPVTLEMGGKNPFIVYPDADLQRAVEGAVTGMNFVHQGQSCGSPTRIFVHSDIYDEFRDRFIARVEALHPGLPWEEEADMGSIVSRPQYDRVLRYIADAVEDGDKLLTGGSVVDREDLRDGLYIQPTVFEPAGHDPPLVQDEIFGPVTCLFRWDDEDEVIKLANDVIFGLTASVWTKDLDTAHRAARRLQAGLVWINDHNRRPTLTPFGGYKQSGIGKERAMDELQTYTHEKSVLVAMGPARTTRGEGSPQ
jgi:acyl-CoA reductase-like NAD-dependent aldehyde dehydrogenase